MLTASVQMASQLLYTAASSITHLRHGAQGLLPETLDLIACLPLVQQGPSANGWILLQRCPQRLALVLRLDGFQLQPGALGVSRSTCSKMSTVQFSCLNNDAAGGTLTLCACWQQHCD